MEKQVCEICGQITDKFMLSVKLRNDSLRLTPKMYQIFCEAVLSGDLKVKFPEEFEAAHVTCMTCDEDFYQ